jgi:hypothetical protein
MAVSSCCSDCCAWNGQPCNQALRESVITALAESKGQIIHGNSLLNLFD